MASAIDEKTRQTLEALGVRDAPGVEALFAEVRAQLEAEHDDLVDNPVNDAAEKDAAVKKLRDRWLARKNGIITTINENWLRKAPASLKAAAGRCFNALRKVAATVETAQQITGRATISPKSTLTTRVIKVIKTVDPTLPGRERVIGSIHPVTRVQRAIEDIFLSLGFSIETGPEIETAYYNFEALNIPDTHPARDDQDTLYVDSETLLRTHTSPVQIRAMERIQEPPLYMIVPGKVYRRDNPDATHTPMFHQIEGLAIDRDITFADLKGVLDYFIKRFFGEKVRTSFHPSFFPFTEPSAEVAISCIFCDGKGCRVCKQSGWIEIMGCGMVHPNVLRAGGIDPKKYSGWAFGLGIDRYAMFKYDINDIQNFYQSDMRFLEQFP